MSQDRYIVLNKSGAPAVLFERFIPLQETVRCTWPRNYADDPPTDLSTECGWTQEVWSTEAMIDHAKDHLT